MKLSEEAQELRSLLERFFAETITPEYRRRRIESGLGLDADFESRFSELGLVEFFSDANTSSPVQCLSAVSHCVGKFLVPSSKVENLLAGCFLPRMSNLEMGVPSGRQVALAYPRCCSLSITGAVRKRISGSISWGLNLEQAAFLVAFVGEGESKEAVLIPMSGKGITVKRTSSLDLTSALYSLELKNVEYQAISQAISSAFVEILHCCKAAEIAGASQHVIGITVDYVKTRKQFGRPVGSFQAIQQLLAAAHVDVESLVSLSDFASWAAENSPDQRSLTSQAAIMAACSIGPRVCEVAMQCHGGIGFTWEYDLHLYLRRMQVIASAFCTTPESADRLIETARFK